MGVSCQDILQLLVAKRKVKLYQAAEQKNEMKLLTLTDNYITIIEQHDTNTFYMIHFWLLHKWSM